MTEQPDAEKIAALEARVKDLEYQKRRLEISHEVLGHNLLGPINHMGLTVYDIEREINKSIIEPEKLKELFERLRFAADHARSEVDLAALMHMQAKPEVENVNIETRLNNLINDFQSHRNRANNRLQSGDINIVLHVLENMPQQMNVAVGVVLSAVSNFLSNAIKFSPGLAPINVDAEFSQKDSSGELYVGVRNYGIGMNHEECARVFEAGATVGADNGHIRYHKGAGLGLQSVARYVSAAGGTYGAKSEDSKTGKGRDTTFWIRVPAQPAQAAP